jgi:hypothetical protein
MQCLPPGSQRNPCSGAFTLAVMGVAVNLPGVPAMTDIRAIFWGEEDTFQVSRPFTQEPCKPIVLPVHCTPAQFGSYLRAVANLDLEVHNSVKHKLVGTITIPVHTVDISKSHSYTLPILAPDCDMERCLGTVTLSISCSWDGVAHSFALDDSPHAKLAQQLSNGGVCYERSIADQCDQQIDAALEEMELGVATEVAGGSPRHSMQFCAMVSAAFDRCAVTLSTANCNATL